MIRKICTHAATALIVIAACTLFVWFVCAWATGATLITFRTGSMAPAMPQGALAVSMPVSAPELHIGDVVTVQREDQPLPVTHRVIDIAMPDRDANPDGHPDARILTLQGDDNETPDHLPYTVTDTRRILFAVPGLGTAIMLAQTPLGMGFLVLGAGTLTVWAFWPSNTQHNERKHHQQHPPRHALRKHAEPKH